jgi:hypothetical protein
MAESQFELRLREILAGYSLPGKLTLIGVETPRVYLRDTSGNVLNAAGTALPTNGTPGYAKGASFLKTDVPTSERGLYENIGTAAACLFRLAGSPRAADITLAAGKIIYGVAPGVGAEKTLSLTTPSASHARCFQFIDPVLHGVGVHAAVREDAANAFPGPFTSPAIPRSLQVVFAAGWQGGDVTVIGTDQFDAAVTETFVSNPGATVVGVKVFKTVVSASKTTIAGTTDVCTLQTGSKIGIPSLVSDAFGLLTCNAVVEAVTINATYSSFIPTTPPDGVKDYLLIVNVPHSHALVYT